MNRRNSSILKNTTLWLIVIAIAGIVYSCSGSHNSVKEAEYSRLKQKYQHAPSPCNDTNYLSLKQLPADSLTDDNRQYIAKKEKECSEYTLYKKEQKIYEDKSDDDAIITGKQTWWPFIGVVAALAAILYFGMGHQ